MLDFNCAALVSNVGCCRRNRLYANDFFGLLNEQKYNFRGLFKLSRGSRLGSRFEVRVRGQG